MNSILSSTKELLGIPSEVNDFDTQLVMHINSAFSILNQLGVGPPEAYQTTLEEGNFETFLPYDDGVYGLLEMYIHVKVRMVFDPPTSSFVLASLDSTLKEFEWRLTHWNYVDVEL